MLIYGTRLYGRCDEIPGLGTVATRFGHLWFVPLIPLQTLLVTAETGDGWRGIPIAMSGKSLLVAWTRAACVIVALTSLVWGALGALAFLGTFSLVNLAVGLLGGALFAGSVAGWWAVGRLTRRATEERQRQLLAAIGVIDDLASATG